MLKMMRAPGVLPLHDAVKSVVVGSRYPNSFSVGGALTGASNVGRAGATTDTGPNAGTVPPDADTVSVWPAAYGWCVEMTRVPALMGAGPGLLHEYVVHEPVVATTVVQLSSVLKSPIGEEGKLALNVKTPFVEVGGS
jgi:hypothetical protein